MSIFPGVCTLLEEIDKKIMVELRDGRVLIGYLRSIDQFANLVLHRTVERIHVDSRYGEIPLGVFIVRGDNVVLLGEFDDDRDRATKLVQVSKEEILEAQILEQRVKQEKEKTRIKALKERGFSYQLDTTHEDF
ncbi:u6 snRNA-associated Sm-like protein LSm1 [Trichonephila clavipes]|uniref:U6 snRNA-associated Sm-like protein LSm1 n=1 Tax=Trichonephila inaurata madagascariensis TaxID=2747483 RepID=A0A8X6M6D3_9ARAC|nr:u6 snRNA-associated Sm-like protein LSm1 [Trichonephila inaurata madagascariensis]GFV77238.1 u6 snRNA-associated Sm-like protein LSm1 [Trichonephila clavipes]